MTKFKLQKKVTQINLRITAKNQAHLQTLTEIPAKFRKDPCKIVGGAAFTGLDIICDGQSDGQTDAQGKQCIPTQMGERLLA